MAKVTDIQDKNGATREIQDKDLANRTSQSSIASSDYVLLEDTNGAYHKIAKASFTEAVRGALGSVINSVAKGTDIAKVPVLDSNNDLGMGTLSNLASVLGGINEIEKVAGYGAIDSIDVSKAGVYIIVDLYYYNTVGVYLRKGSNQQGSTNPVSFEKIFGDDFAGTLSDNTYTFTRRIQAGKVIRVGGAQQ